MERAKLALKSVLTASDYDKAFERERKMQYPAIDHFERECGCALPAHRLESAARVLACPVKKNPPNWQHGRIVYAAACRYLADRAPWDKEHPPALLDIGTAKGFSALCMRWAVQHAQMPPVGIVYSVDVVDPEARVYRNTVLETIGRQGPMTLYEILSGWPEAMDIKFERSSGIAWLERHDERVHFAFVDGHVHFAFFDGRVHFAFVDGRHRYAEVLTETTMLKNRQRPGDMIVIDDLQIAEVAAAVKDLTGYDKRIITAKPERIYAVACKR